MIFNSAFKGLNVSETAIHSRYHSGI